MAFTANTKTFTPFRNEPDKVVLAGAGNNITNLDTVEFGRVFAKLASDGHGVSRPRATRRKTVAAVQGGVSKAREASLSVAGSLPVGMADADIDALAADFAAVVGHADFKTFLKTLTFPQ